eukprot:12737789-Ditylum_brightwellii.AAC.1
MSHWVMSPKSLYPGIPAHPCRFFGSGTHVQVSTAPDFSLTSVPSFPPPVSTLLDNGLVLCNP